MTLQSIDSIRERFPILKKSIYGNNLIYLDNASTTQKPREVVEAMVDYYYNYNSNVHRSVNLLATEATNKIEEARIETQYLINAQHKEEIIFTSNTTESINLIANTYAQLKLKEGDNIIITEYEHHSNIIPWQIISNKNKVELRYVSTSKNGTVAIDEIEKIIDDKTKIISISHVSNVLGTINDIKSVISIAHKKNAIVIIDAAQSISHMPIDVQSLDCEFLVFSSHKMYGPTGIGILYGKKNILDTMPPYKTGGSMVKEVNKEQTTYQDTPYKFEAGTPNIAGIIGHLAAIKFIKSIGIEYIHDHINNIANYAYSKLKEINNLEIITPNNLNNNTIISFNVKNYNPIDIAILLDAHGIIVRSGNHCAQPLMNKLNTKEGTVRASFAIYNKKSEIDYLANTLSRIIDKGCK